MTHINGVPTGWSFEGPDESVGIFGYSWEHEDCDEPRGEEEVTVTEDTAREWFVGSGWKRNLHSLVVLTCSACSAATAVETVDYCPDDEVPA